jgi:hypothetical protein
MLKNSSSGIREQYLIAVERGHVTMINSNASFESLLRESCPDRPSADFFNTIGQNRPFADSAPDDGFCPRLWKNASAVWPLDRVFRRGTWDADSQTGARGLMATIRF